MALLSMARLSQEFTGWPELPLKTAGWVSSAAIGHFRILMFPVLALYLAAFVE